MGARLRGPVRAVLLTAALLVACLLAPGTALLLLPVLPIPFAMLALREGSRPVVAMGAGMAVAGFLGGLAAGPLEGLALALFLAGTTAGLGLVLANCRIHGRFEHAPFAAMSAAWIALSFAIVGCVALAAGVDGVRAALMSDLSAYYAKTLERCLDGSLTESMCVQSKAQGAVMLQLVRLHLALVVLPVIAASMLATAAATLVLARWWSRRSALPLAPPRRLREFEAHWSVAYLLTAGLVAIMVGYRVDMDHPFVVVGAVAAAIAASVLLVQGIAVMSFLFERWRVRTAMRVALWSLLAVAAAGGLGLGWFLALGIIEMLVQLRRRRPLPDDGTGPRNPVE